MRFIAESGGVARKIDPLDLYLPRLLEARLIFIWRVFLVLVSLIKLLQVFGRRLLLHLGDKLAHLDGQHLHADFRAVLEVIFPKLVGRNGSRHTADAVRVIADQGGLGQAYAKFLAQSAAHTGRVSEG